MRDLDDLLEEAKWGTLTDAEFSYVVKKIENNDGNLYTLIHILGRADCIQTPSNLHTIPRGLEYRKLVESFLYYPKDPTISSIALKTLCTYWELAKDYVSVIKEFVKGVDWDEDDELALTAMSIAGEFLRDEKDEELLCLLANRLEDESRVNVESACTALARAAGEEWNDIL